MSQYLDMFLFVTCSRVCLINHIRFDDNFCCSVYTYFVRLGGDIFLSGNSGCEENNNINNPENKIYIIINTYDIFNT